MQEGSFEELRATGKLPSPSGVGMEILRITSDEECSAEDLVHILQGDPGMTGRLLLAANTLAHQALEPATNVGQAAVRLGNRSVRNLALGFSLVSNLENGACKGFEYSRFWSESLLRGIVCERLSRTLRCGSASDLFVCGLLSQLGSLALATVHPDSYADLIAAVGQGASPALLAGEQREFGIDQVEISAAMVRDWKLPDEMTGAIGNSVQLDEEVSKSSPGAAQILWCSTRFAQALVEGRDRPGEMEAIENVLVRFNRWNPEDMGRLWSEVREAWPEWCELLDLEDIAIPEFLSGGEVEPVCDEVEESIEETGEDEPAAVASTEDIAAASDLHVLVVDDDPMSLRLLALRLEKAGYRVTTAPHGRTALRLALELNPQLIIADWMMPEMTGVELCSALRKTDPGRQMYFILLTSKSEEHQVVEGFDSGVDDYVVKPWRSRLLLARVRAGKRVIDLQRTIEKDKRVMQKQVAELGVLTRKLRQASLTDYLTELPNRRCAMEELAAEWQNTIEKGEALSAITIDIDHFKRFNDTYGHAVGDEVLRAVARELDANIGDPVRVFRMGGEEFLVIAPNIDVDIAERIGERLRAAIEGLDLSSLGCSDGVKISLGVAERDERMSQQDELLKAGDDALYAAKADGRNRICRATCATVDGQR